MKIHKTRKSASQPVSFSLLLTEIIRILHSNPMLTHNKKRGREREREKERKKGKKGRAGEGDVSLYLLQFIVLNLIMIYVYFRNVLNYWCITSKLFEHHITLINLTSLTIVPFSLFFHLFINCCYCSYLQMNCNRYTFA